MNIIKRIINYFPKLKKRDIIILSCFAVFYIANIIPQSGREIQYFMSKMIMVFNNPSLIDKEKAIKLSEKDYKFDLKSLDGKEFDFSETKGKVVFINLWATWCPPCVAELPDIQKLYDSYKGNNQIVFLIIATNDSSNIEEFIKKHGYTFPVLISHKKLPEDFKTRVLPTTLVVSKYGEIVIKKSGAANWSGNKIQRILNELISQ